MVRELRVRGTRSGTEPLAPARAARGNDLAAAFGRHAGAKPVTTLAHQLARLIGPLHGSFSAGRSMSTVDGSTIASFARRLGPWPLTRTPGIVGGAASKISRLIREAARARQCDAGTVPRP